MSGSILDCSLNDQIYENSNKTIRIFKTRKSETIKYIAVKVYTKKCDKDKYSYEYNLINKIKSDSVVDNISNAEDQNYLSLCLRQNKNNLYSESTIKQISTKLLSDSKGLYKNGIIHCNLKPSNILIDEYCNVKIREFKKSLKVSTMNAN